MSEVGHNSVAADQLRQYIERIERLEEEKQGIADDVKDVYAEAKSVGFDTKAMKSIVRLRKQDRETRQTERAMIDLYAHALGLDLV